MPEPVGKKLAQARLKRGLSLDEAAHATKLRPEKIVALENDDYTDFPSGAYAKGFLKNYARYLGVDVAETLGGMDSSFPITVAEYQYLTNAPERPVETTAMRRERRPPSVVPLLAGAGVLILAVLGLWVYASAQRIFGEAPVRSKASAVAAPAVPVALPPIAPDLAVPATLSLEPEPPAEMRPAPAPAAADDRAVLKPAPATDTADHDVVTPVPVTSEAIAATAGVNEILVASLKKTWVTVRKDDPKAPPIFEDYVYPADRPLKLRGARFFIEAREPAAVQITKNGLPIAYQAPGVPIQ